MSGEIVKFKGTRFGLQLFFDERADYAAIEGNLREKLESGSGFFSRGTVVYLPPDNRLSTEKHEELKKLFRQHGVICKVKSPEVRSRQANRAKTALAKSESQENTPESPVAEERRIMVINRTLHSGEEVKTKGSVLVCGNVNTGAQIIAGGSIDVRGKCRGLVHAGADGDQSAVVIADRLMPLQIRIAHMIARSPDVIERPDHPERASIKDGQIVIEPATRQETWQ